MKKGTDIDVQLERLSACGLRSLVYFDKYTALSMAESFASDAKQNSHPKASFLSKASQTIRGYLDKDPKQFRAYFLALFAEKEYTQSSSVSSKWISLFVRIVLALSFLQVAIPGALSDPVLLYTISVVFQATLRLGAFAVCVTGVPVGVAFPLIPGLHVAALVFIASWRRQVSKSPNLADVF